MPRSTSGTPPHAVPPTKHDCVEPAAAQFAVLRTNSRHIYNDATRSPSTTLFRLRTDCVIVGHTPQCEQRECPPTPRSHYRNVTPQRMTRFPRNEGYSLPWNMQHIIGKVSGGGPGASASGQLPTAKGGISSVCLRRNATGRVLRSPKPFGPRPPCSPTNVIITLGSPRGVSFKAVLTATASAPRQTVLCRWRQSVCMTVF